MKYSIKSEQTRGFQCFLIKFNHFDLIALLGIIQLGLLRPVARLIFKWTLFQWHFRRHLGVIAIILGKIVSLNHFNIIIVTVIIRLCLPTFSRSSRRSTIIILVRHSRYRLLTANRKLFNLLPIVFLGLTLLAPILVDNHPVVLVRHTHLHLQILCKILHSNDTPVPNTPSGQTYQLFGQVGSILRRINIFSFLVHDILSNHDGRFTKSQLLLKNTVQQHIQRPLLRVERQ
mmetsp:Transcript_13644/g.29696  ORF Transcript_13644/g.29696 Transcript_13644/m.29696 type:complete len:231 (+) Transcript_13644:159-851(+)